MESPYVGVSVRFSSGQALEIQRPNSRGGLSPFEFKTWGQTPFCPCLDGGQSPCWRALQRVSHGRFASNGHIGSFETMLHHRRGLPSFLVSSCLSGTDRLRGGRRRRVSSRPMRFRAPDGIDYRCPIRPLPQAASEAPRETLGIDGSTDSPHEGTSSGGSPPPDP